MWGVKNSEYSTVRMCSCGIVYGTTTKYGSKAATFVCPVCRPGVQEEVDLMDWARANKDKVRKLKEEDDNKFNPSAYLQVLSDKINKTGNVPLGKEDKRRAKK